jgi:lysozyme family protein
MGVNTASTFLQRALNILNRDEKNYKDLKVDGFIGKKTFKVLDIYSKMRRSDYYIFKLVCLLKGKYYIDIVENNDSQEVFIRGWLKRVHLI